MTFLESPWYSCRAAWLASAFRRSVSIASRLSRTLQKAAETQSSSDTRLKSNSHETAKAVAEIRITNKTGIFPPP